MKIAYIVEPRRVIGGGVRAAINLAKSMRTYYREDAVVFGTFAGTVSAPDCTFHEVNTLRPFSWGYWKAFHKFAKSYRPDVVHCLGLFTALFCLIYRRLTHGQFKVVCTVHRVTMNMRHRRMIGFVIHHIARHLDYTTFLTNYQQRHYADNVGFKPNKYVVVPNVIYVQDVQKQEIEALRDQLRRELHADFLTSYVGRIIPSKNLEDFIRIIAIANRNGLNIGGILVGGFEDGYHQKLCEVIEEEDIAGKIKFIGFVNTPTLYTGTSDFTTTTTHGEALPNLLIESFALGKITFSSNIPQMVDLISSGKNGFTLPLKDLSLFVAEMKKICADSEKRRTMEQAARLTYLNIYEPHKVAEVYHQTYCAL